MTFLDEITNEKLEIPSIVKPFLIEGKEYFITYQVTLFGNNKIKTISYSSS